MQETQTNKYMQVLEGNITAIKTVTAMVADTFGPKGLDLMLVDEFNNIKCTNDGVEILSNLQIKHPAAKLAMQAALAQENKIGDGTSTVCILLENLLENAWQQIQAGKHPLEISTGLDFAYELCKRYIKEAVYSPDQNKLQQIAKISSRNNNKISQLIYQAFIKELENKDKEIPDISKHIIAYKNLSNQILSGYFIRKKTHFNLKENYQGCATLIIDGSLEPDPISSEAANTNEGVKKFENNIEKLLEACKKLCKAGIKAVFSSGSIFPQAEEYFVKEGIFVLTHLSQEQRQILTKMSNARLITRSQILNLDLEGLDKHQGLLKSIDFDERLRGYFIQGSRYNPSTILISAETDTVLEEEKRIAIDTARALYAAQQSGVVAGGGLCEFKLALELKKSIQEIEAKYQSGVEIMIEALESIYNKILENAGVHDYSPAINEAGEITLTYDPALDKEVNYIKEGIIDPANIKTSSMKIAIEIAKQILRLKNIVQSN